MLTNLYPYIHNPDDPEINFNLAREYDAIGQTGAALSFYLRCAERSTDILLQYRAILHCALCFERQRCRDGTEKTLLQKAIALMPRRPEAYFLLSRLHEILKEWQECYTMACVGIELFDPEESYIEQVEYPGHFALLFQKGVAAWWVGHLEEAKEIMEDLKFHYALTDSYAQATNNNLATIGYPNTTINYTGAQAQQLRHKFSGSNTIDKNYSQSLQDIFVLSMLDGKQQGSYVEIGSAEPFYNNNTALLETKFGWSGISLDIDQNKIADFVQQRTNPALCLDATTVDYAKLFKEMNLPVNIDYLQIDCDPPKVSYAILTSMPFDQFKFAVITFEHDYYYNKVIRDQSREFLIKHGYQLVVGDIAYNQKNSYEDWWCHPDLVDPEVLKKMSDQTDVINYAGRYMLK